MTPRENAIENVVPTSGDALRTAVIDEIRQSRVSHNRLSVESGISPVRLKNWLESKSRGDVSIIENALAAWLNAMRESREQAAQGLIPADPAWLPTPTAEIIQTALRYAHKLADISVIYGGAGLGKTLTANQYREEHPNVWIATMTPSINTVGACLERVASAVGISTLFPSAVRAENAIVSRVSGTGGLIIVDEAQHISVQCLEQLRSIQDVAKIGMAFLGNESVYTQLTGGSRKAHFAQLYSRIGKPQRLGKPTAADIDTLLDAWGVADNKARSLCREIGGKPGALRGLTKVLRMAWLMRDDNEPVTYDRVADAWADLGGMA